MTTEKKGGEVSAVKTIWGGKYAVGKDNVPYVVVEGRVFSPIEVFYGHIMTGHPAGSLAGAEDCRELNWYKWEDTRKNKESVRR